MNTVVITGANRGIGLELCRLYAARQDKVIAVCRSAGPDLPSLDVTLIDNVDVATAAGAATLQKKLVGQFVDVLINNAGILRSDTLGSLNFEEMLEQYRVNALAPLRITQALQGNLRSGAKVAIVTSRVGSIDDNQSGNNYGYRMSKAAANMAGVNLHHDLKSRGVAVALLHPGYVSTGMTGGQGIEPGQAARGLIERIDALDLASSGGFWHADGQRLPW